MLLLSQNVYWFQGYPAENNQSNTVQEPIFDQLIQIYIDNSPDLIFLQEIQTEEVAKKLAKTLKMNYLYQGGQELVRYGGICLYRNGIKANNCLVNIEETFQRFFQIIQVHLDGNTLNICNLHLPSTAQLSSELANKKRESEILSILNCNIDIDIICGDFNENEGQNDQVVSILNKHGYTDCILYNINSDKSSKIKNKRGDFIFIKNKFIHLAKEFFCINLTKLEDELNNGYILSDHYPLFLRLNDEKI